MPNRSPRPWTGKRVVAAILVVFAAATLIAGVVLNIGAFRTAPVALAAAAVALNYWSWRTERATSA